MERRIIFGVLGFVAAALALGILLPALLVEPSPPTDLPWQVSVNARGNTQIFGITLEETTLAEVEQRLVSDAEVTLFNAPDGRKMLEAYFDQVNLSGLGAKLVLTLDLPQDELTRMYDQGARVAGLGNGTEKVTLASADRQKVQQAPVAVVTYLPAVNLSPEQVEKRFGQPAEKLRETESGVIHYLYPRIGLDLAISEKEKEVLQYVTPANMDRLTRPLQGAERLP